jgi:hypothetical protein
MRTIIAGSRTFNNYDGLILAVRSAPFVPTLIISGTANGADKLGERYAIENKLPLEKHPAMWKDEKGVYRKNAGYLRNVQMAEVADALIALWDGESKGTKHMIDIARRKGLIVHIVTTNP